MKQKLLALAALIVYFFLLTQARREYIYEKARVAVIPPGMVSPFHVALAEGASAKGEEFGWEVINQSPERETDVEGQVAIIEQLIHQEIEAISVSPMNFDAFTASVRTINDVGVPVFMHNTITPLADAWIKPRVTPAPSPMVNMFWIFVSSAVFSWRWLL